MQTIKTIFECNHTIDNIYSETLFFAEEYTGEDVTSIISSGAILRLDYMYQTEDGETTQFYLDSDFVLSEDFTSVKWIGNKPTVGKILYAEVVVRFKKFQNFILEDCPRCSGNGWFLSLFLDAEKDKIFSTDGSYKMVQEFLKLIYTQKLENGYGTNMLDLPGTEFHSEYELYEKFTEEIVSAEVQYKNIMATNKSNKTPSETLIEARIDSLVYDNETLSLRSTISLINALGETQTISLEV